MPALMIQAPDQASPALHAALYAEWQKFRDGTAPVDPEYIPPFILASWERCRESGITTEANSIVRVDALLLEQAQRLNSDLLCSARSIMDKLDFCSLLWVYLRKRYEGIICGRIHVWKMN